MLSVAVDISHLTRAFAAFPEAVKVELRKEMKQQTSDIQRLARSKHRYHSHTNQLRMSTEMEYSETLGVVGLDLKRAEYGVYVHEGHGGPGKSVTKGFPYVWKPDKFLDAALKKVEPGLQAAFEGALKRGLEKAGIL